MSPVEAVQRRRVVVCDGSSRHEIAVRSDMTVLTLLQRVGVADPSLALIVRDRAGGRLALSQTLEDCVDGDVLTVIDPAQSVAPARDARHGRQDGGGDGVAVWAALGALAVLTTLIMVVTGPHPAPVRHAVTALLAVAAVVTGVARARHVTPGGAGADLAPLALAFAAGVVAVPSVPAGGVVLAVVCAFTATAVLAAGMALLSNARQTTAHLAVAAITAAVIAAVWGVCLALSLPPTVACAIVLGATPAAVRLLPTTLVNVPSGMFVDFARFQTLRWSVRQPEPEGARPVGAEQAAAIVARSVAQWTAGTVLITLAAAAGAVVVLTTWNGEDTLAFAGQIALTVCTVSALALQTRRLPRGVLRWMPRGVAVVVLVSASVATARAAGGSVLVAAAAALALTVGLIVAWASVPAGRGMRSLFWSRIGDVIEALTIALALPAGLLAASAIDLLRGMMGA